MGLGLKSDKVQPWTGGPSVVGFGPVRFTFGIPRGDTGDTEPQGNQGPPGEVTNAALSNAISGTSSNTNGVSTLDTPFADPDAETLRQAYNTLMLGLRR